MIEGEVKFKAGATTLEVIRNPQKYISAGYHPTLSNMELEDVISQVDDAGEFRFDIKWEAKNPIGRGIYIFVDTKNYSRASNMFTDLGQFKAYLEKIDSFDQLYIIQQCNIMRESFLKGPRSGVIIQSYWQDNTLITIILKK